MFFVDIVILKEYDIAGHYYTYIIYKARGGCFFMIILLFIFWILLNGRFTADAGMLQIVVVGVVVAGLAYWFAHKALGYTLKSEIKLLQSGHLIKPIIILLFIIRSLYGRYSYVPL